MSLTLAVLISTAHAETSALEVRYRVRFEGVDEASLLNDLKSVSTALELINRPPLSLRQLQRRADGDTDRFLTVLRNHGHYAATATAHVREGRRRARIRFVIDPGPLYTLRTIDLREPDATPSSSVDAISPNDIGLVAGDPARARAVLQAENSLLQQLERRGHPFPRIIQREVRVEHAAHAMDVLFIVDPGPAAVFGQTVFEGLVTVDESFVRAKLPWAPGDPFDGGQLRLAQRRLWSASLFASVRLIRAEELDADGGLLLRALVGERKHRSVTLGAGYLSDEGFGVRAGWEHRNLFGSGERLSLMTAWSEIGYDAEIGYRKPDFRRTDQSLNFSLRTAWEEPDAYRSRNVGALASIDRELQPGLVLGGGTGFKYASVRQEGEEERFGLLYLPARMDWDRSDDVLDPRRGGRLALSAAPYWDVTGTGVAFTKGRIAVTRYIGLGRRPEIDWAGRAVFASIAGAVRDDIPADERHYAGGGGTVRGYAYQSVGPLEGHTPLGGKSLVLASNELRWRLHREFGLVAFLDGGAVYESSLPDDTRDVLWGAGIGIRYFTPVGPLRFDLAFPLDRRDGVDDAYQFYISLGQAF